MNLTLHHGPVPGAIGRIVQLHAEFYAREAGFGTPFEAKVAADLGRFMQQYDAARDLLLLALQDGEVQGSIAIDGAAADGAGAHLRWFIVSDRLRGHGAGARLLESALAFVDAQGWARTFLWTFDELAAARHLYLRCGFQLVHQAPGEQWGRRVNEQQYLRGPASPHDPR